MEDKKIVYVEFPDGEKVEQNYTEGGMEVRYHFEVERRLVPPEEGEVYRACVKVMNFYPSCDHILFSWEFHSYKEATDACFEAIKSHMKTHPVYKRTY